MTRQDLKVLYELQHFDSQIIAATRAKAALDEGAALKQKVAQLEAAVKNHTGKLRSLESEQHDCELELKSVETKKQDYQRKLYEGKVTNPKELEGMEKEIAMLGRQQDKLETRILELFDAVTEEKETTGKFEAALSARQAELDKIVDAFNARSQELSEEIAGLTANRVAMAKTIDESIVSRYDNLRAHMGGIAIGKVEDARCGACHVGLTPYAQAAVKKEDEAPECESCGRYLFKPD